LTEVGYRKGGDGIYANESNERLSIEVRGVARGQEEQDTTIVSGYLRDAGVDANILLLPSSRRAVDDKMKGTFPGLTLNNNTLQRGLGLEKWHSSNVGTPETNWVGTNRSGWSHPEFDRLHLLWTTTFNRAEANQYLVQAMKVLSEELPSLPLYYNFQVVAHSASLHGPQPITPDSTRYGNIHEWEFR
jgi:ABC-type transport system substrate-binding protein